VNSSNQNLKITKLINRKHWTKKNFEKELDKLDYTFDEKSLIIDKLVKTNIIDDQRWAMLYIEKKNSTIKSNKLLKNELLQRGIENEVIDELLIQRKDTEACTRAIEYKRKKNTRNSNEEKKLYNFLISKGFPYNLAYNILDNSM
tara:strand:+ start:63 stop:497 length:435 start_codon:yes stop_codon:yes gene_type:complete